MKRNQQAKPLTVLYIFGAEKAQGAEIVIERLMEASAGKRNMHLLLSPGAYANDLQTINKPFSITTLNDLRKLNRTFNGKLKFYTKAIGNYFSISYKVSRYIRRHDINVVHCNTLVPAAYVTPLVLWSKLFMPGVKWIWSDHDMFYFSRLENLLAAACFRLYNRTLVVSGALKKKYRSDSQKLTVLYNGLNPAYFKPDSVLRDNFREKHGFNDKDLVIGIAGSINPDKGQLALINIFSKLSAAKGSLRLVIAGNYAAQFPDYAQQVKDAIAAREDVVCAGFISNTCAFYNACDIVVNNSNNTRSESLGTTIYEAMACERLVIASATGGTPEIITDKVDGLLFRTEDEQDLLEMLEYAISNFDQLAGLRQEARQKVIRKFNIATMARAYDQIIESL